MENKVYIVDGCRSPFLKFRRKPGPFTASDLAVSAGKPLLLRQPFEPNVFDEVVVGCVIASPNEMNIARLISLRLGCGNNVPAYTVQRNCASGLQAIDSAFRNIQSGRADLILAGGVECMSHAPLLVSDGATEWLGKWMTARSLKDRVKILTKLRPQHLTPVSSLLRGLKDPVVDLSMGQTAEILVHEYDIPRSHMDEYSVVSHRRANNAYLNGDMEEVVPVYDRNGKVYETDDGIKPSITMEHMIRMKPVFDKPFGSVTAGNSSQISDGAAWVILASENAVNRYGLTPLGSIEDVNWAGVHPARMGLGPVYASTPLLQRNQLDFDDIDYWEINEAFAAQVLVCRYSFNDLSTEKLNIDGGAISIGHPVSASGVRITYHLLQVLRRRKAEYGVASLCIGGGQGGAVLLRTEEE